MKAMVIHGFGEPEVMQWEEAAIPQPGPGEVVVKVHSVSVNRTLDLQVRQDGGGYGAICRWYWATIRLAKWLSWEAALTH